MHAEVGGEDEMSENKARYLLLLCLDAFSHHLILSVCLCLSDAPFALSVLWLLFPWGPN